MSARPFGAGGQLRGLVLGVVAALGIGGGVGACRGSTDRAPSELARLDPAQAAVRVRGLVDSCAGFARALDELTHSRISGRLLQGLVDDAIAVAREQCPAPAAAVTGGGAAQQLARSRLAEDRPADALAALTGDDPAIRFRRAELLDRLGRLPAALVELEAALARAPDEPGLAMRRLLRVAIAARAGQLADAAQEIAAAPITERPNLAFRAAADAPRAQLDRLAAAEPGVAELATAIADRLEEEQGPAAALAARERAVALAPELAEAWDAVGRARIAAGRTDDALAAWERAIAIAPAQPSYRLAPIRALGIAGDPARARARTLDLAAQARAGTAVELLVTASAAAVAIGDAPLALALARQARARRPGDGRLAFLVADRLADAGQRRAAADAYAELLVCGAHGRPWHRHEVAGKLMALVETAAETRADAVRDVVAALDGGRGCPVVEPADLATYVEAARGKLARP